MTEKRATAKVAAEVAELEFVRMCEAHRINPEPELADDDERAAWADVKAPIVRLLTAGSLIVDPAGLPTYTPPGSGKGITFYKATGATYMALETYPATKQLQNTVAAMAEMTRTNAPEFGKMDLADFQACLKVAKLFLAER